MDAGDADLETTGLVVLKREAKLRLKVAVGELNGGHRSEGGQQLRGTHKIYGELSLSDR